jgi:hypothetical protein
VVASSSRSSSRTVSSLPVVASSGCTWLLVVNQLAEAE